MTENLQFAKCFGGNRPPLQQKNEVALSSAFVYLPGINVKAHKERLMKRTVSLVALIIVMFTTSLTAQVAKPEQVGLSAERLKRIHDLIERRIEARDISGAVTL